MTHGETLRKENKHRKIVLIRRPGSDAYTVLETHNTLVPVVCHRLHEVDAQQYIDDGYTVVVKNR